MSKIRFRKWGNSLALRIPAAVADHLRITDKTEGTLNIQDDAIVIKVRPRYTIDELLAGVTPENTPPLEDW